MGAAPSSPTTPATPSLPTRFIFVTGDSYSTTGFNMSAPTMPSLKAPMGSPSYPGATLSGYDNWIDALIYNNSKPGTISYNFANGGAPVNSSRLNSTPSTTYGPYGNMLLQVQAMQTIDKSLVPWNATNSLFINWFGVNDIFIAGLQSGETWANATKMLAADISDFFDQLDVMYRMGARKFLTILAPPVYRFPVIAQGQPNLIPIATNLTSYWNTQIASGNSAFAASHPGVQVALHDPTATMLGMLSNFASYGAPDNTCWSYPQGQPCLWHDFIHVGVAIQRQWGKDIAGTIASAKFFSN